MDSEYNKIHIIFTIEITLIYIKFRYFAELNQFIIFIYICVGFGGIWVFV